MASAQGDALRPSPWLSVWLRPRDTIERIVASNPWHHVLLLAALGGVSTIVSWLIAVGLANQLFDQRIAIVALAGLVLGVVGLFVYGLSFDLWGRILGGGAAAVNLRAALAWGVTPSIISLAICVAALIGLKLSGSPDLSPSASRTPIVALQVTAIALGLWSVIATMLMVGRLQRFGFWFTIFYSALAWLSVWLALGLLIVLPPIGRTILFQPFNIPSGAMKPTLLVGDYIFVSKFRYGYSNYSLPFSPPLFSGRMFGSEPRRGDVVVFRLPRDPSTDYVSRVVGLPGDSIQMINGLLHLNGQAVKRERIEDFVETEGARTTRIKQWRETLPNEVSHTTLDLVDNGFYDNTPVYQVPAGHYFMLGDNRDNAIDSRISAESRGVGYVPFQNLVGRVEIIFLSIDREGSGKVRSERLGMIVR
jgi:signal peptidase I